MKERFLTEAMTRNIIWARMKSLCKEAVIKPSKVFPHNLRKLFARTFMALKRILPSWRIFWATAISTQHGSIL